MAQLRRFLRNGTGQRHGPRPAVLLLAAVAVGLIVALFTGARSAHAAEPTPTGTVHSVPVHVASPAVGSATTKELR